MKLPTDDHDGNLKTLEIAATRERAFTLAQALVSGLADLDERLQFATEMTSDDRANLHESARRLSALLDGSGVTR